MGDRMGSSPIDRTKKNDLYIHCASLFFMQGSKGLERDVKKTARCAVFSPRRVNRVSGAKKGVRNACARRVAEQVPSTAPTEKTILLSSFFHFLPKMMWRCRSVGAHVRCARATQMQAHNIGDPRDTVYPWGKGTHKQKSEHCLPDNAISKVQCAPRIILNRFLLIPTDNNFPLSLLYLLKTML